jgi:hypothetical protein
MTAASGVSGSPNDSGERFERRFAVASSVANAVLYEGYVLYPYHASNGKNAGGVRFQWGVLTPLGMDTAEKSLMRTDLIVDPGAAPLMAVRIRCLQLQQRAVEEVDEDGTFVKTVKLEVGDRLWMEWDEAIEQNLDLGVIPLLPMAAATRVVPFRFPASVETEIVRDPDNGEIAGRIVRSTEAVDGLAKVSALWTDGPGSLLKVTIEVTNTTDWQQLKSGRDEVMRRSLIAVHTMAAIEDGAFCSLFDPPAGAEAAVAGCQSIASYAVLVGRAGATDLVLASPIILYDYPAIAPESEGDFHDGCEIDEILALRVLTLTDDEKAEARGTDPRARAIIDRCDNMQPQSWDKLHGIMRDVRSIEGGASEPGEGAIDDREGAIDDRVDVIDAESAPWMNAEVDGSFDPWTDTVLIGATEVGKGARVRLHPSHRADVHDMFLADLTATVAGVFNDLEGGCHVAITVDGDPATELYEMQGRFYYFHPDEIEPLTDAEADAAGQAEMMAQAGRAVDAAKAAGAGAVGENVGGHGVAGAGVGSVTGE